MKISKKYSNSHHFETKGCQITRNLWNLEELWMSVLKKVVSPLDFWQKSGECWKKMNYWKWRNTIFNVPFVIQQMFLWLQFATNLLSIVDITHSSKNKYLIFFKLENNGQILDKLCKDIKGLPSSREWIKKLQRFS